MRIEDVKKIVDYVVSIKETEGVQIDIDSVIDGHFITAFGDNEMINRIHIHECDGVGEAMRKIEKIKESINLYKEKRKRDKTKNLEFLEEICHEESKDCLNMFYKVESDIAAIVIVISNKVFISGAFSSYKPYNFFRSEVERMIEEAKRIKEGLEE